MARATERRSGTGSRPLSEFAGPVRYALVAFLVSLALLNAQVTMTRLLAYRFFYHFVFFVISLSQLGLAAAGAWVYASGRATWHRHDLVRWLLLLAALPLVVLACYSWLAPAPNLSFGKLDGPPAYRYLALLAVVLVALNFCGGMALTLLFTTFKERIGRLYASDLVGASLGCVASVGLMMAAGPIRAFLTSGLAALGAALLLTRLPQRGGRGNSKGREAPAAPNRALWSRAAVLLALLGYAILSPGIFDPYVRNPGRARHILRSEWTHVARTDAQRAGRYVIDGDASTDVLEGGDSPPAPSYELVPGSPDVAIIGVGAGPELRAALLHRARSVLAVDINPTIIRWDLEDDRDFNHSLFHHTAVRVEIGEGRNVLRSSERDFDLIVMHAIDTWTASSQGAYSLTENFLYTSEAMQDFLSKLRPGGVVSIRRWLFWPPRENLRLFTTVYDALDRIGVARPEDQIVVISPRARFRDPNLKVWGFLLFSNRPFGPAQLERLDQYVSSRGWSYLYRPGSSLATPFSHFVETADRAAFYAEYPYIVTPARDSNPFFFQFVLPWSGWNARQRLSHVIYGQSSTLLILCLTLAVGLTVVLLGTPLFLRRADLAGDTQRASSFVYFGCLGIGFMAFELPAIQVMTLYLGHPTYALSVVLLGLLAAAGLGSSLMGRAPEWLGRGAIGLAIALAIGSALGLLPTVHALIHLPDWARFATTLVYLALIGVPLGMPFVAGVRLLDPERPHQVAWAWAVNGATAVVGSCMLMIVMVYSGSGIAFGIAAAAYALALVAHQRLAHGFATCTRARTAVMGLGGTEQLR